MSVPPNKSIISKPKYPIPLKSTSGFPKYCLEGEVKEKFFELYPTHTHPELMQLFGVSYSTIARFAKQYGLLKNIEVIKSKRIKAIKKTCTENGYYASLRGRRPSEASIEATKRIRAAGFSPLAEFKKRTRRSLNVCAKRGRKNVKIWFVATAYAWNTICQGSLIYV